MRIVFVGPFAMQPKHTMAVRAVPLARALAARGHEVLVLLPPWDHPQDAGWEWVEQGLRVYNVRLPPRLPGLFHVGLTWNLLHAALQFKPDVIHCFKPKSYAGLTAWAVWQLRRIGWVKTRLVVDADDWESSGGWNELEHYSRTQQRFFTWQEHWGLTHYDALTVASRALQTIVWSLGASPARVHYLPNGAGAADRQPSEEESVRLRTQLGLGDAPLALLYTRFFEFRLERAVDIMQGVLAQVPDARWLVVGKGLFGEEQRLLALATERGIADHMVYAGWVPSEQVPGYLSLACTAIFPFDDTLINRTKCAVKLVDLLSAGVPVVADRVGQNGEYIQDRQTGLLVSPGDTGAFVAAVVRLLRSPELAQELGSAARRQMQQHLSWSELASMAEQAYQAERL
jgi:glycosyltransferase involved in cell wall biosynthesis